VRTKVLLVVGITLVVMLTLIIAITRIILTGDFSRLEKQAVEKDVERVRNGIAEDLESLRAIAGDYAVWDDSYEFVGGEAPGYPEANLQEDTLLNLSLDFTVYLDGRAGTVAAMATGDGDGLDSPHARAIARNLAAHLRLTRLDMERAGICGLVLLPEGPALIAAHGIVPSREELPPRGVLIVGRWIDDAYTQRRSRSLGVAFGLFPRAAADRPADLRRMQDNVMEGAILAEPIDGGKIGGYTALLDIDGTDGFLLRVEGPRDIHEQELLSTRWFTFWMILVGVVFLVVVIGFLEFGVIARMQDITRVVKTVGTRGDPSLRVPTRANDELTALGRSINGMLDTLEQSAAALRRSERRYRAFLDAIPDMIFSCGPDGIIRDIRMPTASRFAMPPEGTVGKNARELHAVYPVVSEAMVQECLDAAARIRDGGPPQVLSLRLPVESQIRDVEVRITVSGDQEAFFLVRDITAQRMAEEGERNRLLLKEIHHRVKNNLQVISSLLALQANASKDEGVRSQLRESRDRVKSMALIHEKLYQAGASRRIDFSAYLRDLVMQLRHSYVERTERVRVETDLDECELDMDLSVPCGMIVNELLTNSLKHAFPGDREGSITVSLRRGEGGTILLRVSDDGVGMPPDLDREEPSTLGLRIMKMLVRQVGGTLELEAKAGTSTLLTFQEA